jgi:arabinogalactan oligomer/maltooligosaccharide transport system substrate-binding protein
MQPERSFTTLRKYLISILVFVTGLGFVAAQEPLEVWTNFNGPSLEWLQGEVASFSAAFGVPVELVQLDMGDLRQQLALGAPQGEAGDVMVGIPHDQVADLAASGVLADMTTYATASYLEDLSEQALLAYTFGGKLFGLPMFVEGPTLIVNNDLVSEIPGTYEEMLEVAQGLTTDDTFGFMFDLPNFYFAYNWINTFGGYVFDRDAAGSLVADDIGLANEGAIAGASELKRLRYDYGLMPAGTNYDVANGLFIDGALGMIYNGPWAIPDYLSAGLDVSVVPMPPLANGTAWSGFMGVQGVLLNQCSENKSAGANLMKWLTRADAQVSLANLSGRIPASNSALAQVTDDPVIAGFGAALLNAEPMPNIPEMANVWGPMGGALSVIYETEGSDVAATLQNAVDEISGN